MASFGTASLDAGNRLSIDRMLIRSPWSMKMLRVFRVTKTSASLRGRPGFAHFSAAKAALRNLAQALAKDYGPRGVHVGHVVVDGVDDLAALEPQDYLPNVREPSDHLMIGATLSMQFFRYS